MFKRCQFFEIYDLVWIPAYLREAGQDCLSFLHKVYQPYYHLVRPLADWAARAGVKEILDLGSGSAEQIALLLTLATEQGISLPAFIASDLYPNPDQWSAVQAEQGLDKFKYIKRSLSAFDAGETKCRHWSIFTAFHHFAPSEAKKFLQQFTEKGDALCIVELTRRDLLYMIAIIPGSLLFLLAPFTAKKFKWSKFVFTTIIPLVPLILILDGIVSALRSYKKDEIFALLPSNVQDHFEVEFSEVSWRAGPFKSTMFSLLRKRADGGRV